MDLYKHAFRLSPLIASELVADCFELARDIRVLDMRASPYDLSGSTWTTPSRNGHPRIETPEGKREYVEAQKEFAERGQVAPRATRRRVRATPGRLRVASGFSPTSRRSSALMPDPGGAGVGRGMLGLGRLVAAIRLVIAPEIAPPEGGCTPHEPEDGTYGSWSARRAEA